MDLQFDSRILSALHFVQTLQTEVNNDFSRGPYLANLEIEKRRCLYRKYNDGKLMGALLKYFCRFVLTQ